MEIVNLCVIALLHCFASLLQEEGWSMGVVEGTSKKGIFPDNFTKQLS